MRTLPSVERGCGPPGAPRGGWAPRAGRGPAHRGSGGRPRRRGSPGRRGAVDLVVLAADPVRHGQAGHVEAREGGGHRGLHLVQPDPHTVGLHQPGRAAQVGELARAVAADEVGGAPGRRGFGMSCRRPRRGLMTCSGWSAPAAWGAFRSGTRATSASRHSPSSVPARDFGGSRRPRSPWSPARRGPRTGCRAGPSRPPWPPRVRRPCCAGPPRGAVRRARAAGGAAAASSTAGRRGGCGRPAAAAAPRSRGAARPGGRRCRAGGAGRHRRGGRTGAGWGRS
ncbi:hypothetical protein SGLAM104S_08155 [Streptomyces glaucescens]